MNTVHMWTDASALPTAEECGGWAAVLQCNGRTRIVGGALDKVSNNAGEALAVVFGLGKLKVPCKVVVHTDSQYVVFGIIRLIKGKKPLETNTDVWEELSRVVKAGGHSLQYVHTDGHASDELNNVCDRLANYCRVTQESFDIMVDQEMRVTRQIVPGVKKGTVRGACKKFKLRTLTPVD